MNKKLLILAIILIIITLITMAIFSKKPKSEFKIYKSYDAKFLSGIYTYEEFLKTATLEEVLIDDADIEAYDWNKQEIILNKGATERIRNKYNRFNLEDRQFIVVFKEKRIYGGTILAVGSARALDYPIIYIPNLQTPKTEEKILIKIRPYHNFARDDFSRKEIIEIEAIMNYFLQINKLKSTCSPESIGAVPLSNLAGQNLFSQNEKIYLKAVGADAVIKKLKKENENPDDFYAIVEVFEKSGVNGYIITYHLSHKDDFKPENCFTLGNPSGKSRDMNYDTNQNKIISDLLWR